MCTKPQCKLILSRTIQILSFSIFAASLMFAQPQDGKEIELGLMGSVRNFTGKFYFINTFIISPRLGYYVVDGLEIESELMLMLTPTSHKVYVFNGNVSYNFPTHKSGIPFVLVGYGIADRFPIINNPIAAGVLNVGVGAKIFLEKGPTIRIEYRYQKFSAPSSYDEVRFHSVHFGFIVFP